MAGNIGEVYMIPLGEWFYAPESRFERQTRNGETAKIPVMVITSGDRTYYVDASQCVVVEVDRPQQHKKEG
jgi:hypothetical protein